MMANQEVHQLPKRIPGFFYGYVVVMAAFFIMLVGDGIYIAFGVFFEPLITEFGWTRATTSGAFSLSMIVSGVIGIAMGGLTDRFGSRIVMTVCGCFLGSGFLLMSQVGSVWQLYLFWGVIVGIGLSGIWISLLSTVTRWFSKRRSLMTGIVIAGTGMGQLIAPPVVSRLISTYGWRLSYIILGIVTLLVLLLASQFLRRAPSQAGELLPSENEGGGPRPELENEGYSLREAVSTRQFWLVNGVFFCFGFTLLAVEVHIVPHAIELGIPAISAANVLATIGGMTVVGNFVLGYVGDRIGNRQLYIIGFIVWAVAFLWLVPAREMWMLYVFTVLFGFTRGGMVPSESPLVARVFGLSSHGLILGVVGLGFTSGAAIGPFLTGYIFDVTGSYQMAFPVCAAVSIIGLTLAATLRPTKKLGTKL